MEYVWKITMDWDASQQLLIKNIYNYYFGEIYWKDLYEAHLILTGIIGIWRRFSRQFIYTDISSTQKFIESVQGLLKTLRHFKQQIFTVNLYVSKEVPAPGY